MIPRAMNLMLEKNLTRLIGQLFAQIRKTGDLGIKPKFVSTRPSLTVVLLEIHLREGGEGWLGIVM